MLQSAYFFFKLQFRKKKFDVVFVNSVVFNRGISGENQLFLPFVQVCNQLNLKYLIIEDADLKGEYSSFKRNEEAVPYDFVSLVATLIRKIYKKRLEKLNKLDGEKLVNEKLNSLFFRNFDSSIYITLIWNKVSLWRLISPEAMIVDYQHGITMDGHKGYIVNGIPALVKSSNDISTFVYSDLIKNILIKNDRTAFYNDNNVITIGVLKKDLTRLKNNESKNILFSLQITPDHAQDVICKYKRSVLDLVQTNSNYLKKNRLNLLVKHHPRYANDGGELISQPFIKEVDGNIDQLLEITKIHLTFNSTSAIDAALHGIPTIFIDMIENFSPKNIFFDQFQYPYSELLVTDSSQLVQAIDFIENNYEQLSRGVFKWAEELSNDFNYEKLSLVLKNNLRKND